MPTPHILAADAAQILGGGLVQIIVTHTQPLEFYLFLNDKYVPQTDIESFSLSIETPAERNFGGVVRATLALYAQAVSGQRVQQRTELFPSTIEIVALNRRISVTATKPDSVEGLWISLGLRTDGTGRDLEGVQALRILISDGFLDAKLTWTDGAVEDLLPLSLG
jgi:hypothetical protein